MVYLLNMVIFHGYVSHNQRVPSILSIRHIDIQAVDILRMINSGKMTEGHPSRLWREVSIAGKIIHKLKIFDHYIISVISYYYYIYILYIYISLANMANPMIIRYA